MTSVARVVRSIGALVLGIILCITLYEPIYSCIGNLLEGLRGVSGSNPKIAGLAAELLAPMCGGFATVKLAPQPKRKAILWTPGVLVTIAIVGIIFGDTSSVSYGRWLSAIVIGLLGSLYGGSIAAKDRKNKDRGLVRQISLTKKNIMPVSNKTYNNEHQRDGCICLSCTALRDEQHDWNPSEDLGPLGFGRICNSCGKVNFSRSILSFYMSNGITNRDNVPIVEGVRDISDIDNMLKTLIDNITTTNSLPRFRQSKVILVTLNHFLQHFVSQVSTNCLTKITTLRGKKAEYHFDPYPHIPKWSPNDVYSDGIKIDLDHVNRLRRVHGARHEIFSCMYLSSLAEQELTRREEKGSG